MKHLLPRNNSSRKDVQGYFCIGCSGYCSGGCFNSCTGYCDSSCKGYTS